MDSQEEIERTTGWFSCNRQNRKVWGWKRRL